MPRLVIVLTLFLAAHSVHAQDYAKAALPFLQKHCVACHGPEKKKADLTVHQYTDEQSLIKDRKRWQSILQMVQSGEMPPESRKRPSVEEVEAFVKAVNGVFERHDRTAKLDPGRVTMRRLNRAEYNNTIRDLVGVDFNAGEDFPSDDVGHGFDNIGDVLTISPVHMERYLAAAENIMSKAIMAGEAPKPPVRTMAGKYLEPGIRPTPNFQFRPLTSGFVATPFAFTQGGEFELRFRAYAEPKGKDPVKVALFANDKELKVFDIPANGKKAQTYGAWVAMPAGICRTFVKLLDESKGSLHIEWIQSVGPKDTRPDSHRKLLECDPALDKAGKTKLVLERFATRAYRRPVTGDELERLIKLAGVAESRGASWEGAVAFAMQGVLVSPKFLFRVELDQRPAADDARPLDDYQLASRLSYFLWNTMPDAELFELAKKKELHKNIEAQTLRLLKDPRSSAFVDSFFTQWLQLRILKNSAPDPALFPEFDEKLRADMMKETRLFFEAIVKDDRSILDIVDADFSFMNERLAKHYGIVDTLGTPRNKPPLAKGQPAPKVGQPIKGEPFVKVTFQNAERGGILLQASVLTVTSNPTRTSPVKRGRWVLEQILGTPPPPPPPNVPELDNKKEATGTLRQRMEQHRANVACANCHARMDPLGFAFENYNAVGKFRTTDGEHPIDPSGVLPGGQTFQGPKELKAILKGKKELFSRCLAEKMVTYALGRGVEYYDKPALDKIVAALQANDFKFSTLVIEIAKSDPFRLRRGKDKE